jgi:hypothetical protein
MNTTVIGHIIDLKRGLKKVEKNEKALAEASALPNFASKIREVIT